LAEAHPEYLSTDRKWKINTDLENVTARVAEKSRRKLNMILDCAVCCDTRRYELHVRQSCPLSHQPFPQECALGYDQLDYSGMQQSKVVSNLRPYTTYAFKVTSYNEYGNTGSKWINAVTAKRGNIIFTCFHPSRLFVCI